MSLPCCQVPAWRPSGTPPWPTCDSVRDVCVCACVCACVCQAVWYTSMAYVRRRWGRVCACVFVCVCVRLSGAPPWPPCDGVGDVCVCVCVSGCLVHLYGLCATALETCVCVCVCVCVFQTVWYASMAYVLQRWRQGSVHVHACMHVCVCVLCSVCVYVCVCECVCVCVCVSAMLSHPGIKFHLSPRSVYSVPP